MNLSDRVDDLFSSIESSSEYLEYLNISRVIQNHEDIKLLVENIKRLQKESVRLDGRNDLKQKNIDKQIDELKRKLYSIPLYQEYVRRMDWLNDILSASSFQIEKYINSKV